jgi:phenylalanine-4-hydroxylase
MIDQAQAHAAQAYAEAFGAPGADDPRRLYIDQLYGGYTAEDQETWRLLYRRQMAFLEERASRAYLEGARAIELGAERIPELTGINARLGPRTGWQSRAVPGYLPPVAFFACLARREFPTTVVIRPREMLGYLPQPDIFHDVFGHVPLHADAVFAEFLQTWGAAAVHNCEPRHTERLARLFWFTVEFGLIHEAGRTRLYGSGLISSPNEARHALESSEVERRAFSLDEVCETAFEIDRYQPVLYVLEDFAQLRDAMQRYARCLQG